MTADTSIIQREVDDSSRLALASTKEADLVKDIKYTFPFEKSDNVTVEMMTRGCTTAERDEAQKNGRNYEKANFN